MNSGHFSLHTYSQEYGGTTDHEGPAADSALRPKPRPGIVQPFVATATLEPILRSEWDAKSGTGFPEFWSPIPTRT